jgi:hypothetical protein
MRNKNNICKCGCGDPCVKNYIKGHGRRGKKNSAEHRKKISVSNIGRIVSEETKERLRGYNINKKHTNETKQKISAIAKEKGFGLWMLGKKAGGDAIENMSKSQKGHITTDEIKEKISKANSGEKNGMFGKTHSDEYKEKLRQNISRVSEKAHTPEAIEKRRAKLIGEKASEETKRKMRISKIKYINNKNGGICPMHNKNACTYFDNLSIKMNWNLKHALNGGEFYLKNLGYFVDAYDKEKNIIIEYDEPEHYKFDKLKKKDVIRQSLIINELKCRFFRYNEKKGELYEIK